MRRTRLSRVFAVACAFAMALAVPLGAVAHGEAHEHAATSGARQHHVTSDQHHDSLTSPGAEIEAAGGDQDHGHALVGFAVTVNNATPNAALPARAPLPLVFVCAIEPVLAVVSLEPRAKLAHPPPPRLRAPPALVL